MFRMSLLLKRAVQTLEPDFWCGGSPRLESTKCPIGVRDLDLENELKVQRSQSFNLLYVGHFSTQNLNV